MKVFGNELNTNLKSVLNPVQFVLQNSKKINNNNICNRVKAAVFMNTAIVYPRNLNATPFHRFSNMPIISDFVFRFFNFPVPIMNRIQGVKSSIGTDEKKAYNYPFQKLRDNAGTSQDPDLPAEGNVNLLIYENIILLLISLISYHVIELFC